MVEYTLLDRTSHASLFVERVVGRQRIQYLQRIDIQEQWVCWTCRERTLKLRRCSCHRVRYCSRLCQKSDWKRHKPAHHWQACDSKMALVITPTIPAREPHLSQARLLTEKLIVEDYIHPDCIFLEIKTESHSGISRGMQSHRQHIFTQLGGYLPFDCCMMEHDLSPSYYSHPERYNLTALEHGIRYGRSHIQIAPISTPDFGGRKMLEWIVETHHVALDEAMASSYLKDYCHFHVLSSILPHLTWLVDWGWEPDGQTRQELLSNENAVHVETHLAARQAQLLDTLTCLGVPNVLIPIMYMYAHNQI